MGRRLAILFGPALAIAFACGDPYSSTEVAPVEDSGVDAGLGGDAGGTTDAADSADAGDAGSCQRVIDERFITLPPWSSATTPGSSITLGTLGAMAPGSLHAIVVPQDAGSSGEAQFEQQILGTLTKTVKFSFAMRAESFSAGSFVMGCTLAFLSLSGDSYYLLDLQVVAGSLRVDEESDLNGSAVTTVGAVTVGTMAMGRWYVVAIDLTEVTAAGAKANIVVDNISRSAHDIKFPAAPGEIRIKCGIDYAAPGVAADVLVDDITLDLCQ